MILGSTNHQIDEISKQGKLSFEAWLLLRQKGIQETFWEPGEGQDSQVMIKGLKSAFRSICGNGALKGGKIGLEQE